MGISLVSVDVSSCCYIFLFCQYFIVRAVCLLKHETQKQLLYILPH